MVSYYGSLMVKYFSGQDKVILPVGHPWLHTELIVVSLGKYLHDKRTLSFLLVLTASTF